MSIGGQTDGHCDNNERREEIREPVIATTWHGMAMSVIHRGRRAAPIRVAMCLAAACLRCPCRDTHSMYMRIRGRPASTAAAAVVERDTVRGFLYVRGWDSSSADMRACMHAIHPGCCTPSHPISSHHGSPFPLPTFLPNAPPPRQMHAETAAQMPKGRG